MLGSFIVMSNVGDEVAPILDLKRFSNSSQPIDSSLLLNSLQAVSARENRHQDTIDRLG